MTDLLNGSSLFKKRRRVTDHQLAPFAPSTSIDNPLRRTATAPGIDPIDNASSRPTTAIRLNESPQKPLHHRRESSLSSLSELGSSLRRRSASLRSKRAKSPTFWDSLTANPEKRSAMTNRPQMAVSTLSSQMSSQPSAESIVTLNSRPPTSATDLKSARGYPFGHTLKRDESNLRPSTGMGMNAANGGPRSVSSGQTSGGAAGQDFRAMSKRVHDATGKRISLFNYLRMIYASETHWFNTYRFTPSQIRSLPSMHPARLARRTQSLLLLGLSLPFVLDPYRESLIDYLRAFSALLSEYDSYTTLHPPEGSSSSALSRARIPQMFKRAPTKNRRGSSAEALLASPQSANEDPRSASGSSFSSGPPPSATWNSFPAVTQEQDLLPGEDYQFLLTPNLPFDADYFETFSTVCEVLSESYRHVVALLEKLEANAGTTEGNIGGLLAITEMFAKVDAKVKKIVLSGLVREFEDASKQGLKSELAGVGRLVLSGLV